MKKFYTILLVSILISAIAIILIPDIIPMKYDWNGEITRYGSEFEMFLFPAIMLVLFVFFGIPSIINRKKNGDSAKSSSILELILISVSRGILIAQAVITMMIIVKNLG